LHEKILSLRDDHQLNLGAEFVDHCLLDKQRRKRRRQFLVGERFLFRARQLRFALAFLGFDSLLRLEFFRNDKLLLFERLLRGDLLVLDRPFELRTEVNVVEQQIDDMDGIGREFLRLGAISTLRYLTVSSLKFCATRGSISTW
jgi:hypothetical protein